MLGLGVLLLPLAPPSEAPSAPGKPHVYNGESSTASGVVPGSGPAAEALHSFKVAAGEGLQATFNLGALERATTLSYPDPATGERLTTTALQRDRGLGAVSLLGAVPFDGQRRPATITLGEDGAVYLTLPYSQGVLSGEGAAGVDGTGEILLRQARPFRDALRRMPTPLPSPRAQEPAPACVNCS